MKIVSWNMNKRKEGSWSYLIEKIKELEKEINELKKKIERE